MSVKDWLITLIIMIIPLVNIIMLFVWGFGGGTNLNKANWAKAQLLLFVILLGLGILFTIAFGTLFFSIFNGMDM
jgi:hypothetical protein